MATYTAIELRRWLRQIGIDDSVGLPTKRHDLIVSVPAPMRAAWRVKNITGGRVYHAHFTIETLQ